MKVEQARYKANYDKRAGDYYFEIGDRVWLNNKARKPRLSPKLQVKWLGPYTVMERKGDVDYVIQADDSNKQMTVNQKRLKSCLTERCPVPKVQRVKISYQVAKVKQK
jgi:hypothetical protein